MNRQTVLITGASGGFGSALAKVLDAEDYKLFLHAYRNEPCELLNAPKIYSANFTIQSSVKRLANWCEGCIDVLINNAAVYIAKPFEEISCNDINEIFSVNLFAPIYLTQSLWPTLRRNKGMVININSFAGKGQGIGETLYAATKHGLYGFSKSLQFDATKAGIQVVDVFLGAMQTPMAEGRNDYDKFIDPIEAATVVEDLIRNRNSLRVTEIVINRMKY